MSVRTEITPKAIALAAEQQRTEAHLAGVKANDLIGARDLAARDMEEVERQLTWWKSRSPQAQVIPLLQDGYERYAQRVNEAGARAADAARAQQDHERAASELEALAMAAQAEWEQRQPSTTRTDLPATDEPPPVGGLSLPQLCARIGKTVRIGWLDGGGLVGVLERVLRNEHGGEVVALGLNQDGTLLHIDPDDVAVIEFPADHPDPAGPDRTGQDDTGPDRAEAGRMVAESGYPTAPANGLIPGGAS